MSRISYKTLVAGHTNMRMHQHAHAPFAHMYISPSQEKFSYETLDK